MQTTAKDFEEVHNITQPTRCHYKLTILIPAYNERNRIGSTLCSYTDYFLSNTIKKKARGSVSILVIDDGSTDGTGDFVRGKSWLNKTIQESDQGNCWEVDDNVECISLPLNVGKGAAIEAGMASLPSSCRGSGTRSLVLVADADGSGDISCIDNMLQKFEELISNPAEMSSTEQTERSSYNHQPQVLVVGYRQYPESKSFLRSVQVGDSKRVCH